MTAPAVVDVEATVKALEARQWDGTSWRPTYETCEKAAALIRQQAEQIAKLISDGQSAAVINADPQGDKNE